MIKNVIFDMGNVLLDFDPEVPLSQFTEKETERTVIRRELFEGEEWVLMDKGVMTKNEAYDSICTRVPQPMHALLYQCIQEWHICMQPLKGAKEFIQSVKQAGYHIYVLSNASTVFYDYFPGFLPLNYFDGIMISADVHLLKPDHRIYQYFLETYHLNATECLFIDDRANNVEGAAATGMQSVQFQGSYQMIQEILSFDRKV